MFIEALTNGARSSPGKNTLRLLQIQWGWITPGTTESHRAAQSSAHLRSLNKGFGKATRHQLFVHCGWWLDGGMSGAVKVITAGNPEPNRALSPASPAYLKKLGENVENGRLEYVAYPYAACVTEATSFEGLLRSLRFSRDVARRVFGKNPRVYMGHDGVYDLDWGTPQMPHLVKLLGGEFIVSGKEGVLVAPDGTATETFGYEKSLFEIAKHPSSLLQPAVFCMEMHEHLRHMDELNEGTHFLNRALNVQANAVTLDEYLGSRKTPQRRWDSARIGSKGWYGGIIDALVLEQMVKSVELRLPALEALAVFNPPARAREFQRKLSDLWKQSFVLMDNHLLWQCHQFKPHYIQCAGKLAAACEKMEQMTVGGRGTAKPDLVFNPAPWRRSGVVREKEGDVFLDELEGWSARQAKPAARTPLIFKKSSPCILQNDLVRYDLGPKGEVKKLRIKGEAAKKVEWGKILRVVEGKSKVSRNLPYGAEIPYVGCAKLIAEVDLKNERCFDGFLELGAIRGDAYLLKAERIDLTGKVFSTDWQALRSLHWIGNGMPRHHSKPAPVPLKMSYASCLRLTIWLASEEAVSLESARIHLSHQAKDHLPVSRWKFQGETEWKFVEPEITGARVLRETVLSKEVCFSGRMDKARFELHASLEAGSPRLDYQLRLHYEEPASLGVSTPPFNEDEGSLFGAGCERPYIPGLMIVSKCPGNASYHVDKPAYIQRALDEPARTWHTDRRNWWLGMSPFIGMNMAVADWQGGSLGMFTRGIKHFFRWQRKDAEMFGLSLGSTHTHLCTQGHTVKPGSRFFHLTGRLEHDPYFETPFLKAGGDYQFHYAFRPRLETDRKDFLDFWKSAQEFALPLRALRGEREIPGIHCDHPALIATGMEKNGETVRLRVVNLSSRAASGTFFLPFPIEEAKMEEDRLSQESGPKSFRIHLPPWGVREIALRAAGFPWGKIPNFRVNNSPVPARRGEPSPIPAGQSC